MRGLQKPTLCFAATQFPFSDAEVLQLSAHVRKRELPLIQPERLIQGLVSQESRKAIQPYSHTKRYQAKQGHMPLLTYQQYVRHLTYMLRLKLSPRHPCTVKYSPSEGGSCIKANGRRAGLRSADQHWRCPGTMCQPILPLSSYGMLVEMRRFAVSTLDSTSAKVVDIPINAAPPPVIPLLILLQPPT